MKRLLLLAVLLPTTLPQSLHAETTACTAITSLPTTISSAGVYCLKQHLTTSISSGPAIRIDANNVVLDLNGFRVDGISAGTATQATGISISSGRFNNVIRNGTVRGFMKGIDVQDGWNHLFEDLLVSGNRCVGIWINADRSIIRDSWVLNTGGATVSGGGLTCTAVAINLSGASDRVSGTDIVDVEGSDSRGIDVQGDTALIDGNRVDRAVHGITVWGVDALVDENRIQNATYGVLFPTGSGKYRGTMTFDVTNPYGGGTDAGNND